MDFSKASFDGQRHIALSLSDACNRRCTYCYLTEDELACSKKVEVPILLRNLDRLYREHHYRLVTVAGGEPSLLPDLESIVESIARIGYHIIINTNGMLSASRILAMRAFNIRAISYSLDSCDAGINDRLRFRGSLGLVEKGVRFCKENEIPTRISSVICKANSGRAISLFDWCNELQVDVLNLHELDASLVHSFLAPMKLSPMEWRNLVRTLANYVSTGQFHTALRLPIAYLTASESKTVAMGNLSCPALSDDILYISPDSQAYRCPLLLNSKRVSYARLEEALERPPSDNLQCFPSCAKCPLAKQSEGTEEQLIESCKLVKLTVNSDSATSNTPVWSDILRNLASESIKPAPTE